MHVSGRVPVVISQFVEDLVMDGPVQQGLGMLQP
jgi:hypothetical protein